MKYVKFYPVDDVTGVSALIEEPKSGSSVPKIPGLTNLCVDYPCQWYYGQVPDDFVPDPDNHIYELTMEQYAEELTKKIEALKKDAIKYLFEEERYLRDVKLAPYHESATTAGIQKYQEAIQYTETGVASVSLTTEASMREITVDQLCEKIVRKYETFRNLDSRISGLRGKILDRVRSFTLDATDPWTSHQEWETREETLAPSRIPTETSLTSLEKETPETVRYYSTSLYHRYHCMEYLEQNNNVGVSTT